DIGTVKLVASGAGAAAIACLDMMVSLGIKQENVFVADSKGVIWQGREANMEANKARYAQATDARTLADIVDQADVLLGCSAVAAAYAGQDLNFGPDYIIPKPFDPRLIAAIAPAVAKAAEASGVATRPIADMDAYRDKLGEMIYHTGFFMKPVFAKAKAAPKR